MPPWYTPGSSVRGPLTTTGVLLCTGYDERSGTGSAARGSGAGGTGWWTGPLSVPPTAPALTNSNELAVSVAVPATLTAWPLGLLT